MVGEWVAHGCKRAALATKHTRRVHDVGMGDESGQAEMGRTATGMKIVIGPGKNERASERHMGSVAIAGKHQQ